jgi:hypothetical protein
MTNQYWAYAFGSSHSPDAMLTLLNSIGPRPWKMHDSFFYGDYLRCCPAEGCEVRVYDTEKYFFDWRFSSLCGHERRRYRLQVELWPAAAAGRDRFDQQVRELLAKLGAQHVVACEPC